MPSICTISRSAVAEGSFEETGRSSRLEDVVFHALLWAVGRLLSRKLSWGIAAL